MAVDIPTITARLARPIPKPARKRPKPAGSWRKLKPGDGLELQVRVVNGEIVFAPSTKFVVASVNSLGAALMATRRPTTASVPTGPDDIITGLYYYLTNTNWDTMFKRIPKRRKGK